MSSVDIVRKSTWHSEFWRGRRIFVTGHTGFKGAWLSLWLQQLGAEVTGYSLAPPTFPSLFERADIAADMNHHVGDVRHLGTLEAAIGSARPEIVFHLAAQSIVRESYADPLGTFATNVMGTANLLEGSRRYHAANDTAPIRAVVVITSDKCYENREWSWGYREIDPLGGYDPYSASKGCAEIVTASYRRCFADDGPSRLPIASARAGNVIGGGDWAKDRLIPDAVRAFERDEPLIIRNPASVRPWQHVLEPLAGYLRLAESLAEGGIGFDEAWNFGPGPDNERPVAEVVDRVAARWGGGASWQRDAAAHPHEATMLKLDSTNARVRLGWTPCLGFDDAISMTVDWYRAAQGAPAPALRDFTLRQIADYADRMLARPARESNARTATNGRSERLDSQLDTAANLNQS